MSDSVATPNPVAIIDSPIPCSHCGQSLQGVPLDGLCPHCQAPVAATLAPAFIDLQNGTVNADVPCTRCKYNLRSLHVGKVCPECGTPVADDLRSDRLELADPAWRRRILSGVNRLLFAGLGIPAVALLTPLGRFLLTGWEREDIFAVGFAIEVGLAFILTLGVFGVTTQEKVHPRRDETVRPYQLARKSAVLGFVVWALAFTAIFAGMSPYGRTVGWPFTGFATGLLIPAACAIVSSLSLAVCCRNIARRSGVVPLITGTQTWFRLAVITSGVGLLVFILMKFASNHFHTGTGICAVLFACTCIIGAVLWIMALPGLFLLRRTLLRMQTQPPSCSGPNTKPPA